LSFAAFEFFAAHAEFGLPHSERATLDWHLLDGVARHERPRRQRLWCATSFSMVPSPSSPSASAIKLHASAAFLAAAANSASFLI
jgi:hypothetical protein